MCYYPLTMFSCKPVAQFVLKVSILTSKSGLEKAAVDFFVDLSSSGAILITLSFLAPISSWRNQIKQKKSSKTRVINLNLSFVFLKTQQKRLCLKPMLLSDPLYSMRVCLADRIFVRAKLYCIILSSTRTRETKVICCRSFY